MHQPGMPPGTVLPKADHHRADHLKSSSSLCGTRGHGCCPQLTWGQCWGKKWASTFRLRRQWCPWPRAASAIRAVRNLKEDPLKEEVQSQTRTILVAFLHFVLHRGYRGWEITYLSFALLRDRVEGRVCHPSPRQETTAFYKHPNTNTFFFCSIP